MASTIPIPGPVTNASSQMKVDRLRTTGTAPLAIIHMLWSEGDRTLTDTTQCWRPRRSTGDHDGAPTTTTEHRQPRQSTDNHDGARATTALRLSRWQGLAFHICNIGRSRRWFCGRDRDGETARQVGSDQATPYKAAQARCFSDIVAFRTSGRGSRRGQARVRVHDSASRRKTIAALRSGSVLRDRSSTVPHSSSRSWNRAAHGDVRRPPW